MINNEKKIGSRFKTKLLSKCDEFTGTRTIVRNEDKICVIDKGIFHDTEDDYYWEETYTSYYDTIIGFNCSDDAISTLIDQMISTDSTIGILENKVCLAQTFNLYSHSDFLGGRICNQYSVQIPAKSKGKFANIS